MIVNALIVGGGPAGLAPLISASRSDLLDRILTQGVAIAERGPRLGIGRIARYAINSDSTAATFLSCIVDNPNPAFAALRDHPTTRAVAAYGRGSVPLALVGEYIGMLGVTLRDLLRRAGNSILLEHEAISTRKTRDGRWHTKLRRLSDGANISVVSHYVVLATGGHQPRSYLGRRMVGGRPLLPSCAAKLIQSDEALTAAGLAKLAEGFSDGRYRRIVIVGSSSSAMACANAVLHSPLGHKLDAGAVTLLHRRPLRIFYSSVAEALADGYHEFAPEDICPISGFVFRLSGLRLEARELLMSVRGIGSRPPEMRLRLYQIGDGTDAEALRLLDEADLVIAALGYRPRALPLLTVSGRRINIYADEAGTHPLVDSLCRVLDARAMPIEGLFGIGLASGFFSRELVGGELSFSGQTNSLWQWQNAVGGLIAQQLQSAAKALPAPFISERPVLPRLEPV
jgi:hypothetical protein